jgi:hypothetical protein
VIHETETTAEKIYRCCGYDSLLGYMQKRASVSIASLGPENTSSHCVAKDAVEMYLAGIAAAEIFLFDTFQQVEKAVCAGECDLALVPHAYHEINLFYMNPQLEVLFIFISSTPTYGLAKRIGEPLSLDGGRIVTHPAPLPLLQYLLRGQPFLREAAVELVNSTSVAARMVADGLADAAITNATAAREAGLELASIYGVIKMSWSLFCRKEIAA